jgi:hypothetical protein
VKRLDPHDQFVSPLICRSVRVSVDLFTYPPDSMTTVRFAIHGNSYPCLIPVLAAFSMLEEIQKMARIAWAAAHVIKSFVGI